MKSIRISEEVWQAIAGHGKFGENEDDVLRRVFNLPASSILNRRQVTSTRRRSFATQRMTSFISNNKLYIEFQDGTSLSWTLPEKSDKSGIREILNKAIEFARENGASVGQVNAARKTLTSEGYHITK